jgi:hypothetical protein
LTGAFPYIEAFLVSMFSPVHPSTSLCIFPASIESAPSLSDLDQYLSGSKEIQANPDDLQELFQSFEVGNMSGVDEYGGRLRKCREHKSAE